MPPRRGSGSGVLDGQLGNPPEDRPPGYAADLATMHRLITGVPAAPGQGASGEPEGQVFKGVR